MTPSRRQFLVAGSGAMARVARRASRSRRAPPRTGPGQIANVPFSAWDRHLQYRRDLGFDDDTSHLPRAVGLSPVELRTTHRHGVEPTLSAERRRDVRRQVRRFGHRVLGGAAPSANSTPPIKPWVRRNVEQCK